MRCFDVTPVLIPVAVLVFLCFDSFVEGFKKGAKAAEKEINKKFKSEI